MSGKARKLSYIALVSLLFISSMVLNAERLGDKESALVYIIVFLLGLHLSYAYIFNTAMYAQGVTADRNDAQPRVRFIYGAAGILIVGMSYYGIWYW